MTKAETLQRKPNKVVAVANQKGGVGKTTTAVNLAACVADSGRDVLLIDLDPQGNATSGLGVDRDTCDVAAYDVLLDGATVEEAVIPTDYEHLWLLPSTSDLAGASIELVSHRTREFRLREAIGRMERTFDFIILDCPPSLGLLTINALTAASTVLLPVQTEYYALEGMGQLLHTIELVHEHLNPRLSIEGILLTMYDARTNLSEQVADEVVNHFGELVFDTVIPRNVRLSEAPSYGEAIISYDARCRGARSYRDFASEFLSRNPLDDEHRVSA